MSGEERIRRRLTYIGKRISSSGQLLGFWVDEDDREYGYRKLAPQSAPGSRYDVTLSDDGSVFLGGDDGPRYVDRLPADDERVLAWSASDRVAKAAHAQAARARQDAKADAFGEACRPLQELYSGRAHRHRPHGAAGGADRADHLAPVAYGPARGPLDGQDDGRPRPGRAAPPVGRQ